MIYSHPQTYKSAKKETNYEYSSIHVKPFIVAANTLGFLWLNLLSIVSYSFKSLWLFSDRASILLKVGVWVFCSVSSLVAASLSVISRERDWSGA